jgi:hypothetical protein
MSELIVFLHFLHIHCFYFLIFFKFIVFLLFHFDFVRQRGQLSSGGAEVGRRWGSSRWRMSEGVTAILEGTADGAVWRTERSQGEEAGSADSGTALTSSFVFMMMRPDCKDGAVRMVPSGWHHVDGTVRMTPRWMSP